jgi:hypothetical protein
MPTPRFGLPFIAQGQAQKEVTHNDALIQLDALVDLFILDRNLAAPPGSPVNGDTYLVAAGPTGAWAGKAGKLAYSVDGAWRFYDALKGLIAYVADEQAILIYTGTSWVDWSTLLSFQNLPMLGVNTTADATNKLAAKTNAILFDAFRVANGGSGDIQVKLSKETAGDTASFLFQTNYSGRAEIGLAGDDDFTFKVSPDGSSWFQAFKVAAASGLITPLPGGIAGGGRLKSFQYFSANGTWTRPTGIRLALAEVLGAGGGSGGCTGVASSVGVGAGGGGGGYSRKLIDVTAIASVAVTVGTGGTAGANTGTAGGTGGTSNFGAHCSANRVAPEQGSCRLPRRRKARARRCAAQGGGSAGGRRGRNRSGIRHALPDGPERAAPHDPQPRTQGRGRGRADRRFRHELSLRRLFDHHQRGREQGLAPADAGLWR